MKKEIILAIGTCIIAGLCMFYRMSDMMYVGVHALAIGLFIFFATLIWRSKSSDEREAQHKAIASDVGFTVGGTMLAIAMIYQIYTDMKIDVWLMATLAAMVITRVITRLWLEKNK